MNPIWWQLARPTTSADRKRTRLVAAGVAGCGMFLLAAVAILAVRGDSNGMRCTDSGCLSFQARPGLNDLAPYISERGLRTGTACGAVLLMIPFVLFAFQALRTGTAARERRLAALSLAGATRPQLRRLAVLEGTRAAAIGGLLAGPGYLVLWLIFGRALPDGWKMLPEPGLAVLIGWPVVILALAAGGALAAGQAARPALISPLGLTRRIPRPLTPRAAIVPVVATLAIVIGLGVALGGSGYVGVIGLLAATIVLTITIGPWLILLTGRIMVRRGLTSSMAGRRLLADVRSPGRIVGVMLTVGIAFGVIAAQTADALDVSDGGAYYLVGSGAAAIGTAVAAVVASSSLVVGATEQVLDGRRGTAILVALAASPSFISTVVRRQLMFAAVPATMIGAVVGWVAYNVAIISSGDQITVRMWLALPVAVLVSALAATVGALGAARAVRPAIRASSTPDNLRTP